MASKTLSVGDDRPGSQPRRMAAVELRVSRGSTVLRDRTSASGYSRLLRRLTPSTLQTDLLGAENYQVALLPPAKPAPRFRVGTSDTAPPILLLPLTWKELIVRVRAEAEHTRSLQHSVVRFDAVRVDLFRVEVSRSDRPVVLTALEFKVFQVLSHESGAGDLAGRTSEPGLGL